VVLLEEQIDAGRGSVQESRKRDARSPSFLQSARPHKLKVVEQGKETRVEVKDLAVHLIRREVGHVFETINFEGLFGLAFPDMAAEGMTPLFDKMLEEQSVAHPEFAFYYSVSLDAAVVMLGGVDSKFTKDGQLPRMLPVSDEHYWSVKLNKLLIDGKELEGDAKAAVPEHLIFDTGTTLYTAPPRLLPHLLDAFGGSADANHQRACSEVDSAPTLTYVVDAGDGEEFHIDVGPSDYFAEAGAAGQCTPSFMRIDVPAPHGPGMLLGELFMRKWIVVFQRAAEKGQSKVGLAPSADAATAKNALLELGVSRE
jgi:hypothetical protein